MYVYMFGLNPDILGHYVVLSLLHSFNTCFFFNFDFMFRNIWWVKFFAVNKYLFSDFVLYKSTLYLVLKKNIKNFLVYVSLLPYVKLRVFNLMKLTWWLLTTYIDYLWLWYFYKIIQYKNVQYFIYED